MSINLTAFGGTLSDEWHALVASSPRENDNLTAAIMAKKTWPCHPNTNSYTMNLSGALPTDVCGRGHVDNYFYIDAHILPIILYLQGIVEY